MSSGWEEQEKPVSLLLMLCNNDHGRVNTVKDPK